MPLSSKLLIFLYFFIEISWNPYVVGKLGLSTPLTSPTLGPPNLPTPLQFLEKLFNVTADKIDSIVSRFKYDEILTENINFLLYNEDGSVTTLDAYSDENHIEDVSKPIKIIIHGWQSSGDADFVKDIAESYYSIGIKNVISIDWSNYASKIYLHAASATKKIGEIVGDAIINFIKNDVSLLKNVHCIGHSLGAHICGFAGKRMQYITNGLKMERITGLDVAAPLFEYPIENKLRLTKKDAHFVDSIHTNAGFLGFSKCLGDACFYVNSGGPIQKPCININFFKAFICSHSISHDYFDKTITSTDYIATSCKSIVKAKLNKCNDNEQVIMGEHTDQNANGSFYISIDKDYSPK